MELSKKKNKSIYRRQLHSYFLDGIKEDPKEEFEEREAKNKSYSLKVTPEPRQYFPSISSGISSENLVFYVRLLEKLSLHRSVYSYFLLNCFQQKILHPLKNSSNKKSFRTISLYKTPEPQNMPIHRSIGSIQSTKSYRNNVTYRFSDLSLERNPLIPKDEVINQHFSEIHYKFKEIVGKSNNATKENISNYLMIRYPVEICDHILRWVFSGISSTFESWIFEIQKFLGLPREKHYKLAFDIYDFNKDKFICNRDAFTAFSIDKDLFNHDILKIHSEFLLKIQKSTFEIHNIKSINLKDILKNLNQGLKKKTKNILKGHPEALDFEDFLKINFLNDRPQIILDVVKYVYGIDIFHKDQVKEEKIARKKSEEIVREMMEEFTIRKDLKSDKKFEYYLQLEKVIQDFSYEKFAILADKFYFMCDENTGLLTFDSINRSWPKIFGFENAYVSSSFYNFLVSEESSSITKLRFCTKIKDIFDVKHKQEDQQDYFAFSIYDKNKDGWISCVEIAEFFNTLNENSYIYKECTM